jgi:hypothetical protein
VGSLVSSNLLESPVRPVGHASVYKVLLRELGETLRIERILEVFQSECEVQDINIYKSVRVHRE